MANITSLHHSRLNSKISVFFLVIHNLSISQPKTHNIKCDSSLYQANIAYSLNVGVIDNNHEPKSKLFTPNTSFNL